MSKDTYKDYVIEKGENVFSNSDDGVEWSSTIDDADKSIVFDSRLKNGLRIESTASSTTENHNEGRRRFYQELKREHLIVDTYNSLKEYVDYCGLSLMEECTFDDFYNFCHA